MENKIRRLTSAAAAVLCILTETYALAQSGDMPLKDRWLAEPVRIMEERQADKGAQRTELWQDALYRQCMELLLPSRYSSAEQGRKPTVKSQGSYGTCWALAATSALETALLPEERMVFSADHLTFQNAFTVPVQEGGDYLMTMAYLSGWQGPVLEEEDPYGDAFSPEGLKPAVHVQEIRILDGASEQEVKRAVRSYGAVQTSLHMDRKKTAPEAGCYREWTSAYYDPQEEVQNHEILILGWDDSYSRFRFSQIPDRDGAWICQNSWGSEFGEDGLFYVSYADANIGRTLIAYTRVEPTDNYRAVYQTDDCGWQGSLGYGEETCWFANSYVAEEEEKLAAVGFYATGADTSYELYLERGNGRELLGSGSFALPGYYTADLEQEVLLHAGEPFTVIVRVRTPGVGNPVAVEYRSDSYTQKVVTDGKFGYLSHNGEVWTHTEKEYGANVCLKAYTR